MDFYHPWLLNRASTSLFFGINIYVVGIWHWSDLLNTSFHLISYLSVFVEDPLKIAEDQHFSYAAGLALCPSEFFYCSISNYFNTDKWKIFLVLAIINFLITFFHHNKTFLNSTFIAAIFLQIHDIKNVLQILNN